MFCFPGLCKVPTEAECCDLVYPEPLHTVAVTSSWNKFVKLFPGYLGIRTPAESSPKVPQACIWLCVLRDTALTWRTAGCSIRSRTKVARGHCWASVIGCAGHICSPNTDTGTAGLAPYAVPVFVQQMNRGANPPSAVGGDALWGDELTPFLLS